MSATKYRQRILSAVVLMAVLAACAAPRLETENLDPMETVSSFAVLPYHVIAPPAGEQVARAYFGGATYLSAPIQEGAAPYLDDLLRKHLVGKPGIVYITRPVGEEIYRSPGPDGTAEERRIFLDKVGRTSGADAMLAGFVYAFEDKKGSALGVDRPAYVAFDLYIIRLADGRILWRNSFARRQKDLTQSILEAKEFFKAGAKWLTAEQLASLGFEEMMSTFPVLGSTPEATQ